jgi:excisionase family DNA binding protein
MEHATIRTNSAETLLLRAEDVAHRLSLSRATIYSMIANGELPTLRKGRAVRVPLGALERWIEQHTCGGAMKIDA